jgi:hypothetical protein
MQRMQNLISNKRDTISQTNHSSSPGDNKQVLLMISLPLLFNAQVVNKSQQIQAEQTLLSHLFNNAQT